MSESQLRPTFGLSIITKNGSLMLPRILDLITDQYRPFDQIVILDTGSTDGTVEILTERYGDKIEIHQTTWKDDFSVARNECLSHVNTDVFMWLDSDDTFSIETCKRWVEIAQELWDKRNTDESPSYCLVPYYYEVDAEDRPVIVHYRERIMINKAMWVWKEPLHEVCHCEEPGHSYLCYNDCPVVHKPIDPSTPAANDARNWRILMQHFLAGDRSTRTLYYLGRMAKARNQYEFVITTCKELYDQKPGGYYEYESAVFIGDAYSKLYIRDRIPLYYDQAVKFLTEAKRFEPVRNEARIALCDLYIELGEGEKALKEAQGLNEALPVTVATVMPSVYGVSKYAVMAMIYFRLLNNPYQAILNHMKAIDTPKGHPNNAILDALIREYLEDTQATVMYCDPKFTPIAVDLRDMILQQDAYSEVFIFNDPRCLQFARGHYFHLTDQVKSLYREDGDIRLRKFIACPKYVSDAVSMVGYEAVLEIDDDLVTDELIHKAFAPVQEYRNVKSIDKMIELAKRTRSPYVIATTLDEDIYDTVGESLIRGSIVAIVNPTGELVGLAGYTGDVASLCAVGNTIRTNTPHAISKLVVSGDGAEELGIPCTIEPMQALKKVAIIAPGIEDWDGTTPYRWGIGASESSVVYLAEQLVREGCQVSVFQLNKTGRSSIVGGVMYLKAEQYQAGAGLSNPEQFDLVISSRIPEVLSGVRRGRKQVLWMHDIAESYASRITPDQIIDQYICVSDWQRERASALNYKQAKLKVIPNGILPPAEPAKKGNGTYVWMSQPERGLESILKFKTLIPDTIKDLWVLYGFYNLAKYRASRGDNAFLDVCALKYMLRSTGAKITGRIPNHHVQEVLSKSDVMAYPSTFPETFCVAILEAIAHGVAVVVTNNGATLETVQKATHFLSKQYFDLSRDHVFNYNEDVSDWLEILQHDLKAQEPDTSVTWEKFLWSNVVKEWQKLL